MPNPRERDSVGRNVSVVFAGQVVTWLTTAVTLAIIPRYLGAHDMGVYSIGMTFVAVATAMGGMGMGTLITRDVARDRVGWSELVSSALWLNLGLGVVAGIATVAVAWAAGYTTAIIIVVALLAATVPLSLFGTVIGATFTGLEIMRWNVAIDIANKVLFLISAIIALTFDLGLAGLVVASLACSVAIFLAQFMVVAKRFGIEMKGVSLKLLKYLLRNSTPFFMVSMAWVLYTSIDVFMLSWLGEEESVGIYATPMRIFGTALFVPITVTTALFPRLSAVFAESSNEMARISGRVLRVSVSVSILMALVSVTLSDPVVVSMLGKSFAEDTGPVVLALSVSLVPTSISIVASRMAFAANRQSAVAWIGFSAFAGKAALGFLLIPFFNAEFGNAALGAAVVLLAAESAMVLAMLRFLPDGTFAYSGSYYRRLGLATSVAVCACVIGYGRSPLGASFSAVACYVVLLVLLRLLGPSQVRTAIEFVSRRAAPDASPLGPPGGPVPAVAEPEGLGLR